MRESVVHPGREPARSACAGPSSDHGEGLGLRLAWVLSVLVVASMAGCDKRGNSPSASTDEDRKPAAKTSGRILLVHSYHPEYEWVAGISRGVQRALETTGVELETFHMDTKRRTDDAWKESAGKTALQTMDAWNPDVVIAVDDNAQQYFARHLIGRSRPQVVFCGVNGSPSDYGYPAANVTGILERPHFVETVGLLREIVPDVRRIAVLTDDSPTSAGAMRFLRAQEPPVEVVAWSMPGTFSDWQREIASFQERADAVLICMYHTIRPDGDERSMAPRDVMTWTVANSRIPIAGMFSFSIDDGMLCGVVESAVEHGLEAGRLAERILDGALPSEIPIITAARGHRMLNLDTARKLGIEVPQALIDSLDVVVGETDVR